MELAVVAAVAAVELPLFPAHGTTGPVEMVVELRHL
jgi:hypothetical protein